MYNNGKGATKIKGKLEMREEREEKDKEKKSAC